MIEDLLADINADVYLLGLQREFVWSPNRIETLFDSLIRGYPIGVLRFERILPCRNSSRRSVRWSGSVNRDGWRSKMESLGPIGSGSTSQDKPEAPLRRGADSHQHGRSATVRTVARHGRYPGYPVTILRHIPPF